MGLKCFFTLIGCFFLGWVPTLQAGVVSLTDAEVLRLRALVPASPDAGRCAKSILHQAQEALGLTPHPISRIQMAGVLQGSDEKTKTQGAIKDLQYLRALGLAYALTDDVRYLNQGVTYLTAWAQTCQPTEDPIDATTLEPLLESYDLLRPRMEETDRKTVDEWVKSVAYTLRDSDNPRKGSHWNNHQTHRLKTIAMVAFLLNDSDLEKQTLDSLKILMEKNLNPDGTTLDFLQRDALHYHFYDLQAFIRIAILYQRGMDVDLFHLPTGQGASVSQCLAFGLPYARGEKTHAEFVNSTVIFDAQRGANGEPTYISGSAYQPKDALHCLELAQYYEPELTPLVGNLAEKPGSAYPTWRVLLNEAMRSGPLPVATTATASVSVATKDTTAEDYHSALTDYRQGQYALAVSAFQKVLQANPASWQAEQGLGSALLKVGNRDGARQAYEKCLKLNPNNPPVKAALDGLMPAPTPPTPAVNPDQQPFFDDFNSVDPTVWDTGNFTFSESASYQRPSQVTAVNSILTLLAGPAPEPIQGRKFLTGELSTKRLFTYGRFSAKIKNNLVPGLDNCFFLMSPWKASGWHHQELDFEFLGKNPNQVQVNVHKYIDHEGTIRNGGQLPKMIDLGFDSNQAFHVYAIEWLMDKINFYVDDQLVWTETRNLPDQDLNLRLSNFVVNQDNGWGPRWAGTFDPQTLPASIQFDWVKYEPLP